MKMTFAETSTVKWVRSEGYNYNFNKRTGEFVRWGKSTDDADDPEVAPCPEILDIEICTICHGINGKPCPWCYKSNTANGTYMALDTFEEILSRLPPMVTQIAFGLGSIDANPDTYDIFRATRDAGIIPNATINGDRMESEDYDSIAELLGACAVSHYGDDDICFSAVNELTNRGMVQVNIHKLLSKETYEECFELVEKAKTDPRLAGLNAIVFLLLKPKGKRNELQSITSVDDYKRLIDHALDLGVGFGFDSCSAGKFIESVQGHENEKAFCQMAEPCESCSMSLYIDTNGRAFPCSFMEGEDGWDEGVDVINCDSFLLDVWEHPAMVAFRNRKTLQHRCGNFNCPHFEGI